MAGHEDEGADTTQANRLLDLSGLQCPLPVLKTAKAMQDIQPGELIDVICTDPMAKVDVPHFCAEHGHTILAQSEQNEKLMFRIRKGAAET